VAFTEKNFGTKASNKSNKIDISRIFVRLGKSRNFAIDQEVVS